MGYRYIGSKVKIVDKVINKISELCMEGGTVCDLMSGTGVVSSELRKRNYKVIANDLMTYSYHHSIVNLKFSKQPEFNKLINYISNKFELDSNKSPYENVINFLNNTKPIQGYFWKEFSVEGTPSNTGKSRNYFHPENAKKIDGIRYIINILWKEQLLSNHEYSLLQHDLIMASNDVANIAGTYGHYMAKLNGRALSSIRLECSNLFLKEDIDNHIVMQGYAEKNASNIQCDLCYIDPPYMKRQYAANYHILETLARGDEPEAIGISGLRPWREQYSNFCTKTKIRQSIKDIVENMNCNNFLISYSEDGLLSIEDFQTLLSNFGDIYIDSFIHKRFKSNNSRLKTLMYKTINIDIYIDSFIHKRFKSNNSRLKNELTEYLIYLQK